MWRLIWIDCIVYNIEGTKMKKMALLVLTTLLVMLALGAVPPGGAVTSSSDVVFIPSRTTGHGGSMPYLGAAYAGFTFSTMGWTSVSAASLAAYDTVVLMVPSASIPLTTTQESDLVAWVSAGGKLIIYDSESASGVGVDYSWLPYPFTTRNPGAMGYSIAPIVFVENNSLGSTDPTSPYYIDTASAATGAWSDYVGDCNTFVTFDPNWCGDIKAHNYFSDPASYGYDGSPPSGVHAYARYGDGIIIYNGFDIDPMYSSLQPSSTGTGNCAKIWLMELQQPWNPDGLPCGVRVAGITLEPQSATNSLGTTHTVTATILDDFGDPVPGIVVDFEVLSGPNAGTAGLVTTDANGEATFSYTGNTAGTDEIRASFYCTTREQTIYSNTVEKTWEGAGPGVPEFGLAMPLMIALLAAAYFLFSRRLKAGSIK
jgi:hypothetical protein